jgi:hypothetical protein
MLKHLLLALGIAGCTSGSSGGGADAPTAGAFGAACTTVVDTGSTECTSGVCTNSFDMIGHPVCSQKCTAGDGSTCPSGSMGMKCNQQGYCRP